MDEHGKIEALNTAAREALPEIREAAGEEPGVQVLMRTLSFSDGARWLVPQPTPVEQFVWSDVSAGGATDMGQALKMVAEAMKVPPMEERAVPPILVLISDGIHTDDVQAGLDALLGETWGARAVRVAIAIGRDADHGTLKRFIANAEIPPLQANRPADLVRYMRWVSTRIRVASRPVGAGPGVPIPGAQQQQIEDSDADPTW